MISQQWIGKGAVRMLCTEHWPDDFAPAARVVLLPGFSHSMCDADYMMSKLARRLSERHFAVTQVDLRGHGDSPFPFHAVNLSVLREDIETLISYYQDDYCERLFFIGRGLTATLLAAYTQHAQLAGIGGIAPYCLPAGFASYFTLTKQNKHTDAWNIFPGNDYIHHSDFGDKSRCMLNALGAIDYNLHGMNLSTELIEDLAGFDAQAALLHNGNKNTCWLYCDPADETKPFHWGTGQAFPATESFLKPGMPRNPKSQDQLIRMLNNWISDLYLN